MSPDSRSSSRSPAYRKRKSSSPVTEKKKHHGSSSRSKTREARSRSKSTERNRGFEKKHYHDRNRISSPKSKFRDNEKERERRHQMSKIVDISHKHKDKAEKSRSNKSEKWSQSSRNSALKGSQDMNGQVNRWPHDRFLEQDQTSSGVQGYHSYRDRHRRVQEDDFMDQRRQERERIGLVGIMQVWGKSPPRCEELVSVVLIVSVSDK